MRIVGGRWRGRKIAAPPGRETRPTSDRAREGLFGALEVRLGTGLSGAVALDLFAGTGALGLEALSRGASRAVFVENAPAALSALEANIAALGADGASVIVRGDAFADAGARAGAHGPFALLLLDPPYRIDPAAVSAAVARLDLGGAFTQDVLVTYEHERSASVPEPTGFTELRTYVYGDTAITLFGRDSDDKGRSSA